jgi:hypothetical protein
MEQVEALLEQVPAESLDAQSAKDLEKRIKDGRARMEKARKEQEDAIASAHQVDSFPSTPLPAPPPEPSPAPAEPADSGTVEAGPVAGSPASELRAGYQGCFQPGRPITVTGHGLRDSWEMSSGARCSLAYPAFVAQVVLVEEGKVLAVLPKSSVQVTFPQKDGGASPGAPDAGP